MKTILTTTILLFSLVGFGQSKPDTSYDRYVKESQEYDRKRADTANYREKDISSPNSGAYSTELLPMRDTVKCYFEYITGDYTIPGRGIETTWWYGFAIRKKEVVIGFMYDEKTYAPVKVLTYKILTK